MRIILTVIALLQGVAASNPLHQEPGLQPPAPTLPYPKGAIAGNSMPKGCVDHLVRVSGSPIGS
ncbi:MAG: hypothetical protein EA367_03055 [Leptolyngbya sp. DLM2.Bin15]|nr:MAG: hypothetical protein EA367_03055 [Leptolyngbya sp. DLM2.Bin15]